MSGPYSDEQRLVHDNHHPYTLGCAICNDQLAEELAEEAAARAAASSVEPTGLMTHCPGCNGWVEEEYLHREECPGVGIEFDLPSVPPPDPAAGLREAAEAVMFYLDEPGATGETLAEFVGITTAAEALRAALLAEPVPDFEVVEMSDGHTSIAVSEPVPLDVERRFETPNDFMHYTHDTLDMHRGLMIPGCIYCNGDM